MLDRVLEQACRPLLTISAFFTQKPSLMSRAEWKLAIQPLDPYLTPFSSQTSSANDMSFLMGVLGDLPALFLQCDECIRQTTTKGKEPQQVDVIMVWRKVKQLQHGLQAWKQRWDDSHCTEIYMNVPSTKMLSTQVVPWATVMQFSSVDTGNIYAMFHTIVILLASVPTSLFKVGLVADNTTDMDYVGVTGEDRLLPDVLTSVRSICRSIEYFFHFLVPSQSPPDFYIFFPMHVARRASIQLNYNIELAWLTDATETLRSSHPMGIWANMDLRNHFTGLQEGLFG